MDPLLDSAARRRTPCADFPTERARTEPIASDHSTLKLADALQLLQRSGHPLPDRAQVGDVVWLQSLRSEERRVGKECA